MKSCIKCIAHSNEKRAWEITADARVWPCCYFGNAWDKRKGEHEETELMLSHDEFAAVMFEDPNWNSLEHHEFDDIINHTVYKNIIWYTGWESDNPHPLCVEECGVHYDEIIGNDVSNSVVNWNDLKNES